MSEPELGSVEGPGTARLLSVPPPVLQRVLSAGRTGCLWGQSQVTAPAQGQVGLPSTTQRGPHDSKVPKKEFNSHSWG